MSLKTMQIPLSGNEVAEIVSKFYDRVFCQGDIDNGIVTEEMVRFAVLCEFGVIHKNDLMDIYEQYASK